MKIYVASSWRNDHQQHVVGALREDGHKVYDFKNPKPGNHGFSWKQCSAIAPSDWTPAEFIEVLRHPVAADGFHADMGALEAADATVMVLPCGRSAHLEAGWARGAGQQLVIVLDDLSWPTPGHTMRISGGAYSSSQAACGACGDLDGCHEPARRRRLREPELMYKMANFIAPNLAQARTYLRHLESRKGGPFR